VDILDIIFVALTIVYGLLTLLTCVVQLKKRDIKLWSNLMMLTGGIVLIITSVFTIINDTNLLALLCLGLVLIHISAIFNGIALHKKINPQHHIIRFLISTVIIILYCF
jgi:uncharacterized membrane protein